VIVVLPAPDGEERMYMRPRRLNVVILDTLFLLHFVFYKINDEGR
jgi:hypothetical protein